MTNTSVRIASGIVIAIVSTAAFVRADQRRAAPGPQLVPAEISLKVAGDSYDAKGQASCTHAPKGSIYNVISEMWTVRHEQDGRSFQLTLWKPVDGSASMFTLAANGKKNVSISTVRGGEVTGTGTVTLAPSGKGGKFAIDAKAKGGDSVSGTITCEAFTPAIAEGGNE